MLTYHFNKDIIDIKERATSKDVEFKIKFFEGKPFEEIMKKIQTSFEQNEIHTDVLFYIFENNEYQVIVRNAHYVDFILALLKHRLLESASWNAPNK